MKTLLSMLGILLIAVATAAADDTLDLSGDWRVRLDPEDQGQRAGWPSTALVRTESIRLPNTTDRAGLGFPLDQQTMTYPCPYPVTTLFPGVKEPTRADQRGFLVRRRLFVGPAWYERTIRIPDSWADRIISLRIERTIWRTEAWIDGRAAGSCDSLVADHIHELGPLSSGEHRLTVRVDNRMIHNLSTITHSYGPETQSRWNGMIGKLELISRPPVSLGSVRVFPATDRCSARVQVEVLNKTGGSAPAKLEVHLVPAQGTEALTQTHAEVTAAPGLSVHEMLLHWRRPALPWDEFSPRRYRAAVGLQARHGPSDQEEIRFGFRQIERVGQEIRINGRRVFLRGTLDCCVYPATGHPPMSVNEWERVLGVIQQYGFNLVRFHTWCPPDAAFEAADRLGIYLQPELPAWVDDWGVETVTKPKGVGRDADVAEFLRAEMRRLLRAYGNHPSFVMLTLGNEFGERNTHWDWVDGMLAEGRSIDPRRLYAGCTARRHLDADDYWVTHDSGAPTRGIGPAHTDWDFARAVVASPVPVIAHETGQRPVFPDYDTLLPKFAGPLLPLNLERYRRALAAAGLDDQLHDFVRASARFQLVQYKAEHEAMLRTRGLAGYQLLMLNDFTGQSEALVGVLDPFWQSKGVVNADDVRAWNSPTVVLARFPRYVWTNNETFDAQLEVAHFGADRLPASRLAWTIKTRDGQTIAGGERAIDAVETGKVSPLGHAVAQLAAVRTASALTLAVRLGEVENHWHLWVYPASVVEPEPAGVLVTRMLDAAARQAMRRGARVLWLAHDLKSPLAARTDFASVYWSAGWWGNTFSGLGINCDPAHPALREFPNEGWSDWQWHDLCAGATTFNLTGVPRRFRPVVQLVPDFHFNTLLAQVFETKFGPGSLLVCGYDLDSDLDHRLAARQFRRSLFHYVASPEFHPSQELPEQWLEEFAGQDRPDGKSR